MNLKKKMYLNISHYLVMTCLDRIYFEALKGISHQFKYKPDQGNMNFAKIET